jgi:hypothetical protein
MNEEQKKITNGKVQIIYERGMPHGIRDENGYLFFFPRVSKWSEQEERYRKDIERQYKLADYLLQSLQGKQDE